ncbi:hypothetical protein JZ751_018656 [Albula glossodonta]|uniref:Uncharacterized protein n=1 Tax=Albula glossodonta TaxID=121402 RepID=A0A8T2MT97_9TELE|nr:hypothetical protein JZ751_018656 [Albula glossodonta]
MRAAMWTNYAKCLGGGGSWTERAGEMGPGLPVDGAVDLAAGRGPVCGWGEDGGGRVFVVRSVVRNPAAAAEELLPSATFLSHSGPPSPHTSVCSCRIIKVPGLGRVVGGATSPFIKPLLLLPVPFCFALH